MKPPTRPLVLVTWNDAHSPASTDVIRADALEKVHGSLPMITVGWVLRDDPDGITVAGEYCGEEDYRNGTFIPRNMVVSMVALKKPRKKPVQATSPSFDLGLTLA